jgi:hypothetical protein
MTVCPIALAVGCSKCPAVSVCPLKSVLGDYKPEKNQVAPPSTDSKGASQVSK